MASLACTATNCTACVLLSLIGSSWIMVLVGPRVLLAGLGLSLSALFQIC